MTRFSLSTTAFRPLNQTFEKVPIFFDDVTQAIEELPTLWMFHLALERSRTESPRTWQSYADSLIDWLRHLAANGWDTLDVSQAHLGAYRQHMLHANTVFGSRTSRATINARITTVRRFYEWLHRTRKIASYPFTFEDTFMSRPANMIMPAHRNSRRRHTGTLRVAERIPMSVPSENLRYILKTLGMRDALIVRWALATGARRNELISIDLDQLPEQLTHLPRTVVPIRITKTKGSIPRTLKLPVALFDETWRYVHSERARIAATSKDQPSCSALFLSERCVRLSASRLQSTFHAAQRHLPTIHRFHDLRHTFAIARYLQLVRAKTLHPDANFDPLTVLQVELGHLLLETTSTYLRSLKLDTTETGDLLMSLLDEITGEHAK